MIALLFHADPKIKPRACATEKCIWKTEGGKYCNNCLFARSKNKPFSKKPKLYTKKNTPLQKHITKADEAGKLYKKCLILHSLVIRGTEEYNLCETCPPDKRTLIKTRGGLLYGLHAGHYLPKNPYWKLALDTTNGLRQCHTCNVVNWFNSFKAESLKHIMRTAMVSRYGQDSVIALEQAGHDFITRVHQSIENTKPRTHDPLASIHNRPTDIEWLENQKSLLSQIS